MQPDAQQVVEALGLNRHQIRMLGRGKRFLDRAPGLRSHQQASKAERFYGSRLRKIAARIGELVGANPPESPEQSATLLDHLRRYSLVITPWANSVAQRMIADVAREDRIVWRARGAEMGRLLHREIETAPTGLAMQEILADQVGLITSLPIEAAERVHKLTIASITNSTRAREIAAEIMRTGEVTTSRAMTIARTEVSRTATTLTKVRAEHVGSTRFEWVIADSRARAPHKALNHQVFRWDTPPECDPGYHALPGCIWNCRCRARPLFDD